ncbi:hypothetical protein LN572_04230 [Xanthomonas citri pv. fuscans]|uniref:hypothetical protein n=1 Tax=Xanthomonas citri TaxID=346 RepID=UPI001E358672|nr:hypothetical protein [Xanthomonas citri]MCC8489077.1 hypothetical protein [Xanthomonas citri pv. fuscans]
MKLLYWLRSSGLWAGLLAVTLMLLAYLANWPSMFLAGWVSMGLAALYAGRYSPDAKRAKALQAHAHVQRAKAANTREPA